MRGSQRVVHQLRRERGEFKVAGRKCARRALGEMGVKLRNHSEFLFKAFFTWVFRNKKPRERGEHGDILFLLFHVIPVTLVVDST
jgi:hypothetical protein